MIIGITPCTSSKVSDCLLSRMEGGRVGGFTVFPNMGSTLSTRVFRNTRGSFKFLSQSKLKMITIDFLLLHNMALDEAHEMLINKDMKKVIIRPVMKCLHQHKSPLHQIT